MGGRLLGICVVVLGVAYLAVAAELPTRTLSGPGPGIFPLMVGAALLVTGAIAAIRPDPQTGGSIARAADFRAPMIVFVGLAAFCILLQRVGYVASGALVMVLVLRAFAAPWRLAASVTLVAVVATWLIFVPLLGLTLPRGSWIPF